MEKIFNRDIKKICIKFGSKVLKLKKPKVTFLIVSKRDNWIMIKITARHDNISPY